MTIREAIDQVDLLKPNTYKEPVKIGWLSRLDAMVKGQVIDTHKGADKEQAITEYIQNNVKAYEDAVIEYMKVNEVSREEAKKNVEFRDIKYKEAKEHIEATRNDIMFAGYDEQTPQDTVLLMPEPYAEAYLRWLEAQIDYANGEYDKYNNSIVMFNTAFQGYKDEYNRTHLPKAGRSQFF